MKLMECIYLFYKTQTIMKAAFTLHDTEAPDKTPYPYATYQLISQVEDFSMDQEFENCLVQFNLYSSQSSPAQLEAMFEALKGDPDDVDIGFDFCGITVTDYTTLIMERITAHRMRIEKIWQYAVTYRVRLEKT